MDKMRAKIPSIYTRTSQGCKGLCTTYSKSG
nr:MAG TPA: hypothetical protein [Caudoviricetes sp.]DAX26817.1 MAG TPA: hypothetical protein [Caudoviricetes sp.]